jgi:hypothetical protein
MYDVAGLEHTSVGVQTLVPRQQRGVDVEHTIGKVLHELLIEYAHVPCEHHELSAAGLDGASQATIVVMARFTGLKGQCLYGDTAGGCLGKARGLRLIGEHRHHLTLDVSACTGVEQRQHVAAGAGDQHCNPSG